MMKSKYDMEIMGLDKDGIPRKITVDIYSMVRDMEMSSAVEHCWKKGPVMGKRSGGKSYDKDLDDMIWSLNREKELRAMEKYFQEEQGEASSDGYIQ